MIILEYNIPKWYKDSLNSIYSGIHWTKRREKANYWHNVTKIDVMNLDKIDYRIELEFKFFFKSRMLDSSNCAFMWKMLEDSLVKNWLLEDDSPEYVANVKYESIIIDPKERKKMDWDKVEIIIKPYEIQSEV